MIVETNSISSVKTWLVTLTDLVANFVVNLNSVFATYEVHIDDNSLTILIYLIYIYYVYRISKRSITVLAAEQVI